MKQAWPDLKILALRNVAVQDIEVVNQLFGMRELKQVITFMADASWKCDVKAFWRTEVAADLNRQNIKLTFADLFNDDDLEDFQEPRGGGELGTG